MLDRPEAATGAPALVNRAPGAARGSDSGDQALLSGAALLAIVRRRKLALLLPMLLVPLLASVAISRITPLYTATGRCSTTRASTSSASCRASCGQTRLPMR